MGRAQTDIGDAGMLDGMAARIEKLPHPPPPHGEARPYASFFQPVFLDNFYIIIQKHYIFAARQPTPLLHMAEKLNSIGSYT